MMAILAWVTLGILALDVLTQPARFGKARMFPTYSFWTWVCVLVDAAILVPLCGRVLGWW